MEIKDPKKNPVPRKNPQAKPAGAKPATAADKPSGAPARPSAGRGIETTKTVGLTLSKIGGKILTYTLNVLLTLLLIGVITGSAVACALAIYVKNYVDPVFDIDNLKFNSSLTTTVYYEKKNDNGTSEWVEWEEERIHGSENRLWVSYDEMPEDLINAFVSIEDYSFFEHKGVNTKRTVGAVIGFVTGSDNYGGSTITQQLIKNVTGDDDITIQRKVQEILRAYNFEKKHSKEEILEMYLNTIYLSQGCYGVSSAAYKYFGKEVSDLTLVECAALASIPKYPTKFDPIQNPENKLDRRTVVLNTMYENDCIEKSYTLEEIRAAKAEELVLSEKSHESTTSTVHSWYVDSTIFDVIEDLQTTYGYDEQTATNLLYSGGLKIYLAIDRDIQNIIDDVYQNNDNFPSKGTGLQVESAMTVIDQSTGKVMGIVGGRGKKDTPLAFNRATMAKRQPGSSIKPLAVYSLALDRELINYSTVLDDTPFKFEKDGTTWPNNYNKVYEGLCTVQNAVRDSKNTIAVKVLDLIGPKNSYEFMINKFHFSTLVPSDMDYAPLALGGFTNGVTNRDMCTAYAAIANNGVYNRSKTYVKVLDSDDNVVLENNATPEVILSEDACAVMTRLLQDVVASGTASGLTLKRQIDCACKTGTTTNNYDLYFCGYTPYYTAACWVGYDISQTLSNFTSGQTKKGAALYLWDTVMTRIHEKIIAQGNLKKFSDYLTKQLITKTYCKDSGLLAGENCGLDLRGKRTATGYYCTSNMPAEACTTHVLVDYCTDCKCVAGPVCEHTKKVALVSVPKEQRTFKYPIFIVDAQYTYMPIKEGTRYPTDPSLPFYHNLYSSDTFPGYTNTRTPANAYCITHNTDEAVRAKEQEQKQNENPPEPTQPPPTTTPKATSWWNRW